MAGFVAFGDIVIAVVAFAAGVYFADWAKGIYNWIRAKF